MSISRHTRRLTSPQDRAIGPDGRRVTTVSGEPERGHDVESVSHRAECRACRATWKARENRPEPGADGWHRVQTPSGRRETYFDPRGLEAPFSHHDVCGTCGVRISAASEAGLADLMRQHLRGSPRCRGAEEKLRQETGSALTPQDLVKVDPSRLTAPTQGSAALEVSCECCGRTTPASSMVEVEAVKTAHLAGSRRCADWAAGRSARGTFEVRIRKTG